MALALTNAAVRPLPPLSARKRWTRAECATLEATGEVDCTHLELVEGELIDKMGKYRPHVAVVNYLAGWLKTVFGEDLVNTEAPIDVSPEDFPTSEPIPDVVVLKRSGWDFRSNPQPADLHLVAEVSDSTLAFDLNTKAALYARAGIPEYWALDIKGQRLIVHREPSGGRYQSVIAYSAGESVAPLAAPHAQFDPSELFSKLSALGMG